MKQTKGQEKMMRHINDLVRKRHFRRLLKRLKSKDFWAPEQKEKADNFNKEIISILDGYEILRKKAIKLLKDNYHKYSEIIAYEYGLDGYLIQLALAIKEKDEDAIKIMMMHAEPDMCKIELIHDDALSPSNAGEEIIYLNPFRKLRYIAFPVAVSIHQRAAKRDVLDFIEKNWKWIESHRSVDEKTLKFRKRKHSQELLDFIWQNQSLSARKLKKKLDEKFPKNGLVYYEISKLISLERQKRLT